MALHCAGQRVAKPVIGYLHSGSEDVFRPFIAEFLKGLRTAGFIDGQNVTVEYRWAQGALDKLPSLAAELIDTKVSLIVASGGGWDAPWRQKPRPATVPIVFTVGSDPLQAGLVASLARPGGNLTGVSILNADTQLKRLEWRWNWCRKRRQCPCLQTLKPENWNKRGGDGAPLFRIMEGNFQYVGASTPTDLVLAFAVSLR